MKHFCFMYSSVSRKSTFERITKRQTMIIPILGIWQAYFWKWKSEPIISRKTTNFSNDNMWAFKYNLTFWKTWNYHLKLNMFSTLKEFSDDMINEHDLYVVWWNMPRFKKICRIIGMIFFKLWIYNITKSCIDKINPNRAKQINIF